MSRIYWPCAHCGGAVREPLTMAALRHARDPRAVLVAFRALEHGGPSDEEVALAARATRPLTVVPSARGYRSGSSRSRRCWPSARRRLADVTDAILESVGAARVSLSEIDAADDAFEIIEARGEVLLGPGTRFPLGTSTHHTAAAEGTIVRLTATSTGAGASRGRSTGSSGSTASARERLCPCGTTRAGPERSTSISTLPGRQPTQACALVEPLLGALSLALAQPDEIAPTSVLVCHDDPLVSHGIARLLEETGAARASLARSPSAAVTSGPLRAPDVVIGDLSLGGSRIDAWIGELRAAGVDAPLLVIASHDGGDSLAVALAAGATGFVLRSDVEDALSTRGRRRLTWPVVAAAEQVAPAGDRPHSARARRALVPRSRDAVPADRRQPRNLPDDREDARAQPLPQARRELALRSDVHRPPPRLSLRVEPRAERSLSSGAIAASSERTIAKPAGTATHGAWPRPPRALGRPLAAARRGRRAAARRGPVSRRPRPRRPHYHAAIVRSQLAHARIEVDAAAALAAPRVVGVLTGADVAALSRPFPAGIETGTPQYAAAIDTVRYVGEPIAVVVASDRYLAEDAAELVEVDYDPLDAGARPGRRGRRRASTTGRSRTATSTGRWPAPTSCSARPSTSHASPALRSSATRSSPTGTRLPGA